MKQFYAGKLEVNEEITDFFMIKSAAVRTGSNGKDYLDLGLGDCSGEINGKKWDISPDELPAIKALAAARAKDTQGGPHGRTCNVGLR